MKVIGLDDNGGCICTVSVGELRRIIGDELFAYGKQFHEAEYRHEKLVGAVISVQKRYDQLIAMEMTRGRLDQAIGALRTCADALEPLVSVVKLPELPAVDTVANESALGSSS